MKRKMLTIALIAAGLMGAARAEGADVAASVDLTGLLQAVLSLAVSLITAYLIPWLKAKYSGEQRAKLAAVYETIVFAAEQTFGAGRGEEKLEWAVSMLGEKGIRVDRAAIEAEVLKLKGLGASIRSGA